MKKSFIVTITDSKGIKSYKFSKKIKKIISMLGVSVSIYLLISVIALLFLGGTYIKNIDILSQNMELRKFKNNYEEEQKREQERENKKIDMNNLNEVSKNKKRKVLAMIPNSYPVKPDTRITSQFGGRIHPIAGVQKDHKGIDFGTGMNADILSTADGIVSFAGQQNGYGNVVIIDHSFGLQSFYAHLDSYSVKTREFVKKGQIVAKSGNTGNSTGPHLHYEIRFYGVQLDPMNFMKWDENNFDYLFKNERSIEWESFLKEII